MRKVDFIAIKEGSIEENLRQMGISSSICLRIRKKVGLIKYKGKDVFIIEKIKKGEPFSIVLEDETIKPIEKYDIPIKIIYEDEDFAIIDKQYNLAVINTRAHFGKSLENALANIWGDFVYRPVNRLDRDTTGLMIIAKHQLAHSIISQNKIKKKYLAYCEGKLTGEGIIDKPIKKSDFSIMERVIDDSGLPSQTIYKVKKNYKDYTLVELELLTGRTHQIRVHLKSIGHPLIMDTLYGNKDQKEYLLENGQVLKHQALHAYYLEFVHPITRELMKFESVADYMKE